MIQKPKLCIETHKVLEIEETIKVTILQKNYLIKIKETKNPLEDMESVSSLRGQGPSTTNEREDSSVNTCRRRKL